MTVEEIKALQAELGVTVDGIIGPETKAAAVAAVSEAASSQGVNPEVTAKYQYILDYEIPSETVEDIVENNDTEIVTAEDFFAQNVQADKFGSALGTTL